MADAMDNLTPINPEAIYRNYMAVNGRKGGLTKTPARLAALAKARRRLKQVRKERRNLPLGTETATIG